ncbi:MAG: Holliday junction branch migration protein RuvA [Candidatus Saccharibacteria bacterium]
MIAKISGKIVDILPKGVIVDVAGVGYEVLLTEPDRLDLSLGDDMSFYIAENIKEDEHSLYGFILSAGREMYYRLTSVSGVGPKAAMSILSVHSSSDVSSAIFNDDVSLFSSVSGIGKKTAQRIILDLKGKLVDGLDTKTQNEEDPAFQALLSLGYGDKDAKNALQGIDSGLDTQERVRQALKGNKK